MSKPRTLCCYDISYEDAQLLIESAKSYTVPRVGVSQESSDSGNGNGGSVKQGHTNSGSGRLILFAYSKCGFRT